MAFIMGNGWYYVLIKFLCLAHLKTSKATIYQVTEKEEDDVPEQEEYIFDDDEDNMIVLEDEEHDAYNK